MPRGIYARRKQKKVVGKKTAVPPKREYRFKHLKLSNIAYDELSRAVTGGGSQVAEILGRLRPGETDITTLAPASFNKYRSSHNIKVKSGFFYIAGENFAPIRCTAVTRVS